MSSSAVGNGPIGIFDSGIGGLTVLRALREALPDEAFLYLGDTARLPYGTKSPETITRYLSQNVGFMRKRGVKALVVACNTASSVLKEDAFQGIPVFGVIKPGSLAAIRVSKGKKIGVLGTTTTVGSGAYEKALKELDPLVNVVQKACPLLVPLVEEGWETDPITREVLKRYLQEPLAKDVDTLILGCTHYPVLKPVIESLVGDRIGMVDSATEVAEQIKADIDKGRIAKGNGRELVVMTTDVSPAFKEVGTRILGPYQPDQWLWADMEEDEGHEKF